MVREEWHYLDLELTDYLSWEITSLPKTSLWKCEYFEQPEKKKGSLKNYKFSLGLCQIKHYINIMIHLPFAYY